MNDLWESLARHAARLTFVCGLVVLVVSAVTMLRHTPTTDLSAGPTIEQLEAGKPAYDPLLARQQAIEEARAAGVLCMGVACAQPYTITACGSSDESLERDDWNEITRALDSVGGTHVFDLDLGRRWATRRSPPRHRIVLGAMTDSGGISKLTIKRHVKRSIPKISSCYERYRFERVDFEGIVFVRFSIERDGHVLIADGAGFDAGVASCVAAVISEVQFPKPDAIAIQVQIPITFYASHASSMVAGR